MSDDPGTDSTTPAPSATEGTEDDVKRKFREALDRKRGTKGDSVDADSNGRPKIHGGAHGPAQQQRNFRRKSG